MSEVNLPEQWLEVNWEDLTSVNGFRRGPFGGNLKKAFFKESGYAVYEQYAPINDDCTRFRYFVDEDKYNDLASFWVQGGDFLVSCSGTMGRITQVPQDAPEGVINQALLRIRLAEEIWPDFFLKLFRSPSVQESVLTNSGGGAIQNLAAVKELKLIKLPLPPLAEQKVIADKLDTLLAQVETTKARLDRIPKILNTFRQSVLAAAMSGKLTEEWREKNDASAWQQKILGDVVTGISQGWSPKCLSEGTSDTSWGVIKTSSVQEIQFLEQENKKLPDNLEPREALKVEVGDILTTRAGPRSRCGVTCYVENLSLNLMICDKVYRYKAKTEIGHSKFLVMQLNSHPTLENIESLKTGISESGMNLTQKKFKALPLKWPSKEEQTQIVSRVEELFAFAERIEQKANAALERVNNLTQSILAKAFRGELTADWRAQNPDLISGDNSAEALLEKIKAERDANKNANKSKKKITRKAKPKKEIQPKILLENPVVDVLNKKGIAKPQAIFDELKELMDLREVLKEISQLLEQQVIKEIDKDGQQYLEINR
tara:strand:- start:4175 stop:5806 length:1632 start_codon:yes stop_codon:yes gene_type:complete